MLYCFYPKQLLRVSAFDGVCLQSSPFIYHSTPVVVQFIAKASRCNHLELRIYSKTSAVLSRNSKGLFLSDILSQLCIPDDGNDVKITRG